MRYADLVRLFFLEPSCRNTKLDERPPSVLVRDGLCLFNSLEHCLVAAYHIAGKEETQVCELVYRTRPKILNSMSFSAVSLPWFLLDAGPPDYFQVFTAKLKDVCGPSMDWDDYLTNLRLART